VFLLALVLGCGSSAPTCSSPEQVLVDDGDGALTCADVDKVEAWIELIAGRPLQHNGGPRLVEALMGRFRDDEAGTRALLADIEARGRALEATTGLKGGRARSEAAWAAHTGHSAIKEGDPLWNIQRDALSVWAWSNEEKLALTEADVEGWIRYASLCRQVQGGGTLRISVADRVAVYRVVVDRFEGGDRNDKLALVGIGPFWQQMHDRWNASPYERQQKWIGAAPLPPGMTTDSMGYLEAVLAGDLAAHVTTMHDVLGPFSLNRGPLAFDTSEE